MKLWGRRRRYLVDRFQLALLGVNLLHFAAALVLLAAALFAPTIHTLLDSSSSSQQLEEAASTFLVLHSRVWPALLVALVLISCHSILVSHRIAGPLYRFRRVFESIEAGDLTARAGIRTADYLGKDAQLINRMIAATASRLAAVEEGERRASAARRELEASVPESLARDLEEPLRRLANELEEIREGIGAFRLPPPSPAGDVLPREAPDRPRSPEPAREALTAPPRER